MLVGLSAAVMLAPSQLSIKGDGTGILASELGLPALFCVSSDTSNKS